MEGSPPSISAYARGERNMFKGSEGPGPAAYCVKSVSVRNEMIAPFDTTAVTPVSKSVGPGPAYFPVKKDHREYGTVEFRWGDRFHEKIDFSATCTDSEPVWGRVPNPWVQTLEKILAMSSKRPRVSYDKYFSNNIPTIYHPLDVRCFIKGIDGREYPWRLNRNKSASPSNYNTYQVYISQSKITPKINFGAMSKRKSIFVPQIGAGPAGYFVRRYPREARGEFLGKRFDDPKSSAWRLFDILERRMIRDNFTGPAGPKIPSGFDKCSPTAVLAPFKSKTPLGFVKPVPGPGPAQHFLLQMQESDLLTPLKPGLITFPPEKAPFETSQKRFVDPELYEMMDRPAPSDYDILGFTDMMKYDLGRHAAAVINPKLGFLTSAIRPYQKEEKIDTTNDSRSKSSVVKKERKWRNIRPPRTVKTYTYHGQPPRLPDSPGPIYDTAPAMAALKCHKTWLDARHFSRNGFLNSGCERKTNFYQIDKDVPGVGSYYSRLPCCTKYRGKQAMAGPRFKAYISDGPGPVHKLHEKAESSMWRASHLGTFNSNLKHTGVLYPWAGGFRKRNLDQAGDSVWGISRPDDYAGPLCPLKANEITEMGDHKVSFQFNKISNTDAKNTCG